MRLRVLTVLALSACIASTNGSTHAASFQAPDSSAVWQIVAATQPPTPTGLAGISALSASTVWTVGSFDYAPLIEQLSGKSFTVVPSPYVSGYLDSVSTDSVSDAWAVGATQGNPEEPLAEHWDGSSWTVSPTVSLGTSNGILNGVVALSPSNVWAVGWSLPAMGGTSQTLIEHWDGSSWSIISGPIINEQAILTGVAAASPSDIWAVGTQGTIATLAEHWNGSTWSIVSTPNTGDGESLLLGVSCVPGTHTVWSVGTYYLGAGIYGTLIERWDGTSWSIVPSPSPGSTDNRLNSVAASSASTVWAAGYEAGSDVVYKTLIEQWNGSTWSVASSPSPDVPGDTLSSVTALPKSQKAAAVGAAYNSSRLLVEAHL